MKVLKNILGVIAFIAGFTFLICLYGIDGVTNWGAYLAVTGISMGVCFACLKGIDTIEWFDYLKEREKKRNERNFI